MVTTDVSRRSMNLFFCKQTKKSEAYAAWNECNIEWDVWKKYAGLFWDCKWTNFFFIWTAQLYPSCIVQVFHFNQHKLQQKKLFQPLAKSSKIRCKDAKLMDKLIESLLFSRKPTTKLFFGVNYVINFIMLVLRSKCVLQWWCMGKEVN